MQLWSFEPSVLIGTSLLIGGYALFTGPLRRRFDWGEAVPPLRQLAFYAGSLCMLVALIGPLDALGDEVSLQRTHGTAHAADVCCAAALGGRHAGLADPAPDPAAHPDLDHESLHRFWSLQRRDVVLAHTLLI